MEEDITYAKLISVFLYNFPEVIKNNQDEIDAMKNEIEQNFIYMFYEDIVKKIFLNLLTREYCSHITNDEVCLLQKLVNFFEKLAISTDKEVVNLLGIAVFEELSLNIDILNLAYDLVGDKTKEIFKDSCNIKFN